MYRSDKLCQRALVWLRSGVPHSAVPAGFRSLHAQDIDTTSSSRSRFFWGSHRGPSFRARSVDALHLFCSKCTKHGPQNRCPTIECGAKFFVPAEGQGDVGKHSVLLASQGFRSGVFGCS